MNVNSEANADGPGRRPFEVQSWWARALVGRHPARTVIRALLLVLLVVALVKWCFMPIRITGRSMEPTYQNGKFNVINRLAYHRHDPRRGDVVGIQQEDHIMVLMKRVLGLPGERVAMRDGIVHINGQPLKETYAKGRELDSGSHEVVLGPDEYFVVGDNRNVSEFGVVARSEIKGKVMF